MESNANTALDIIITWEGPEVNIANSEPGGISKYGISLTTYADYCLKTNITSPTFATIENLTETDARTFYANEFLPAIRFNDLPNGIDVRLADISINLGITGAVNLLEMVLLQFPLSDQLSNTHIQLLNSYTPEAIILSLSSGWITNKKAKSNTASWALYGHGWSNRNLAVTGQCLTMIKGANNG